MGSSQPINLHHMNPIMKAFLIILCLTFSIGAFSQLKSNSEINVKHYQFELTLSDSTDVIQGVARISVLFKKDVERFTLDLMNKTSDGKGMQVSSVATKEGKVSFLHEKNVLTVLSDGKEGSEIEIIIYYSGIPDDGLIIARNKYGDRTFFGDNWPNRAHHWLPVVDHPSDKASVDFIVTAPIHYEVVGNGLKLEESYLGNNKKITHWRETVPIATKVMVIGAARFAIQYAAEVQDIAVEHWVYPQDRLNGFHDYAAAEKILTFFIKQIGDYPYKKLANVQSKTKYGGMENASNIFYFENSVNGKADHDNLIAHEIAHQWFGNSASETDWHHVWLSEGFATYFTHIYNEYTYGEEKRAQEMTESRDQILKNKELKEIPIVLKTLPQNLLSILNSNSYQKGGWVLHMLRREIGDDAFWKAIRAYYQKYQNSNASTADFQSVVESVSGKDLDSFFNQWLFQPGHPELEIDWKHDPRNGTVSVTVNQTQKGQVFKFPLDIGLYGEGQLQQKVEKLEISQKTQKFTIKTDFTPVRMVADPNVNLLFESKNRN